MSNFKEIINGDQPVLVDFSAEWCGPCKMMAPILKNLASAMGDKIRILKVDVDKNLKTAQAFNIQGVPTLILFKKGKVLWRESGVVPENFLLQLISKNI